MKKIAIVIAELAVPGGAEKVAADLMEEFHRRHYDVTVIRFDELDPGETAHEVPVRDIHLHIPGEAGGAAKQLLIMLKRAWQFRKIFQREKFDHIFAFLEQANIPCALASPASVLSVHLDPNTMTRNIWRAMYWIYPRAKRVVAVSHQMQTCLEEGAKLKNVACIYNPINTRLICEKAAVPINIEGKFILAVGRMEQQKRFDLLLTAFAKSLAREHCKLVIVGKGSLKAMLTQQVLELGLENQAILVGYDNNPYKYMAKAELQVMSSDYEGYPLVLIEALSLGCPIVSTDCPTGPREIIEHEVNGLLVEKGNIDAIAKGIDQLFFDDTKRERMRQAAIESVRNNDIVAVADAWLKA